MNRYVKKPIAIETVKWKGFNNDEIKDFAGDSVKIKVIREVAMIMGYLLLLIVV